MLLETSSPIIYKLLFFALLQMLVKQGGSELLSYAICADNQRDEKTRLTRETASKVMNQLKPNENKFLEN
jgi:hypothetical protein